MIPGDNNNRSISIYDRAKMSELVTAAETGDLEKVRELLSDPDCDVNCCFGIFTPLIAASSEGHIEVVRLLLTHPNIDVNRQREGFLALNEAATEGHSEIVQLLLSRPETEVNEAGKGDTPLIHAIYAGHTDVVKQLLKHPDMDVNLESNKNNPLATAAILDKLDIVRLLLKRRDLNVNQQSEGKTTLHKLFQADRESSKNNHKVLFILKEFINLENIESSFKTLDSGKDTPLARFLRSRGNVSTYTVARDYLDIIYLICDTYPCSIMACSYILPLAIENAPLEVCQKLLEKEVDVNSSFAGGENAIFCAIRSGFLSKVRLLCNNNARLDTKWQNMTPLEYACSLPSSRDIIYALSRNISIHERRSGLASACFSGETIDSCAARLGLKKWIVEKQKLKEKTEATRETKPAIWNMHEYVVCAHRCNYFPVRHKIIKHLMHLLIYVSLALSKLENTAHLTFISNLVGSMGEGTKTFILDEADVVCELVIQSAFRIDGRRIKLPDGSPWLKTHSHLPPRLAATMFYDKLRKVLLDMFSKKNHFGNLYLHHNTLETKDKISKIRLMWRSRRGERIVFDVDLVIGFSLLGYTPVKPLPLGVQCSQYHLIPKSSIHKYEDDPFRISDACAEVKLISGLPNNVKRGLTLAKAVRITDICTSKSVAHLSLRENIDITDFVTTYMLKTCLFHLLDESDNLNGDEVDWAERIYGKLVAFMEKKGLPNYHENGGYVFSCRHENDNMSFECCYKWQVIICLCRTLHTWLLENRQALKHAAHGKHLVYSRTSRVSTRLAKLISDI